MLSNYTFTYDYDYDYCYILVDNNYQINYYEG